MRLAALLLFGLALPAVADVVVPVCHGYGCIVQDEIRYSEAQLTQLTRQLAAAVNPENERKLLAEAIGQLSPGAASNRIFAMTAAAILRTRASRAGWIVSTTRPRPPVCWN